MADAAAVAARLRAGPRRALGHALRAAAGALHGAGRRRHRRAPARGRSRRARGARGDRRPAQGRQPRPAPPGREPALLLGRELARTLGRDSRRHRDRDLAAGRHDRGGPRAQDAPLPGGGLSSRWACTSTTPRSPTPRWPPPRSSRGWATASPAWRSSSTTRSRPRRWAAASPRRREPRYWIRDWMDMNRNLFAALQLEKLALFVIVTIIVLVAGFAIIGHLILLVAEKRKEIGILKAMGATSGSIGVIFLAAGMLIGLVGTVAGQRLRAGHHLGAEHLQDHPARGRRVPDRPPPHEALRRRLRPRDRRHPGHLLPGHASPRRVAPPRSPPWMSSAMNEPSRSSSRRISRRSTAWVRSWSACSGGRASP